MGDDHYRLVEYVLWAGSDLGRHGLSRVENMLGGVWVVLKFEWQPPNLGVFPVKSCKVRPGIGPASSSSFSSFLGPMAAWGCLLLI